MQNVLHIHFAYSHVLKLSEKYKRNETFGVPEAKLLYYLVGVKLEKVHEHFQVYRICAKRGIFLIWLSTAYYKTKVCVIMTKFSIYINFKNNLNFGLNSKHDKLRSNYITALLLR